MTVNVFVVVFKKKKESLNTALYEKFSYFRFEITLQPHQATLIGRLALCRICGRLEKVGKKNKKNSFESELRPLAFCFFLKEMCFIEKICLQTLLPKTPKINFFNGAPHNTAKALSVLNLFDSVIKT